MFVRLHQLLFLLPMASPSSSFPPRNWSYNVFPSFHGPDVRKTFLSNMREQFTRNGITMFDDQEIERSATIAPSLTEAIRESRISIVILSKNYASSGWCLDELVEILECKKAMGQTVMTIFYGVEPSNVRKQTGEFGIAFNETCARKRDEARQKWSKALTDVSNIAGEDFQKWDNEANMIKKIARDVSDKLNATPSRDFDGMVGLETHLRILKSLLDLDYDDGVKMVAITGPLGIGKTTIAKALHVRLSNRFQLSCFMDNLRGSYVSGQEKLRLQEQFLSKVLNQDGLRVCHSGVIEERLCKQRVLIILDDVNNIKQLEALANETTWFGPGSRIVVTTENKDLLQQHGIDNTYHVGFPSDEEALKILCRYAFRKIPMYHGFGQLAKRVTKLCGNLPLALSVVGSSLRGKNEKEWQQVIHRLETTLHQDIEEVLKVGYESLDESEQTLFLHIAVFFNYKDGDLVETMFTDNDLDVKHGLKILVNRSLIEISTYGEIMMHRLLQQVGKKAIHKQEPWKRKILIDAPEICDVLEYATGTRAMSGISFDISGIKEEVSINKKAFKRMPNLRFLRVYKSRNDGNDRVHIPEEMELPHCLRLLDWEEYPSKSLHPTFHPEYLVELSFEDSKLEKLWEGRQVLTNLKKINLTASRNLKELPDLSEAINLEVLSLLCCESLVEIPSSCLHLHKLQKLLMNSCTSLEFFPAHMNLASLEQVFMAGCSRLRNIPVMSTNITNLYISDTLVEDLPASIELCSRLEFLSIASNRKFKGLTHLPTSVRTLDLSYTDIERIPDCIKDLLRLESLDLSRCLKLASLPQLPCSLRFLTAQECESLETVFSPLDTSSAQMKFTNCFKLSEQARRGIIQPSFRNGSALLPGKQVPPEFDHRGKGNCLTIPPDVNSRRLLVCIVISHNHQITEEYDFSELCRPPIGRWDFDYVEGVVFVDFHGVSRCREEHVYIFDSHFPFNNFSDVSREIVFEFSSKLHALEIIECGVKLLTDDDDDESIEGSYESGSAHVFEDESIEEGSYDSRAGQVSEEESIAWSYGSGSQMFEEDIEFVEPREESFVDETNIDDLSNGEICVSSNEVENLAGSQKRTDCWSWLFLCFGLSVLGKKTIESG
ncbi:PREDICTED: disease resistance protein RML1B-like isoform X2 [Camelina sativa]|uniref:Disease resistance protein RML1B-like isoform X2 n=1 Tax=Camelina sativa TaxID=90675 RepID=A0ABM1QAC4_CAMSA|nr:PREDICTED: disease resistance protein RML1B-like isoform X2 [Camelina sativa]